MNNRIGQVLKMIKTLETTCVSLHSINVWLLGKSRCSSRLIHLLYLWVMSVYNAFYYLTNVNAWAVVVAQLVKWLLPIPEIFGSNPVIGKILFWTYLLLTVEKTKINKKRPGMYHLKTNVTALNSYLILISWTSNVNATKFI